MYDYTLYMWKVKGYFEFVFTEFVTIVFSFQLNIRSCTNNFDEIFIYFIFYFRA